MPRLKAPPSEQFLTGSELHQRTARKAQDNALVAIDQFRRAAILTAEERRKLEDAASFIACLDPS